MFGIQFSQLLFSLLYFIVFYIILSLSYYLVGFWSHWSSPTNPGHTVSSQSQYWYRLWIIYTWRHQCCYDVTDAIRHVNTHWTTIRTNTSHQVDPLHIIGIFYYLPIFLLQRHCMWNWKMTRCLKLKPESINRRVTKWKIVVGV